MMVKLFNRVCITGSVSQMNVEMNLLGDTKLANSCRAMKL